ncbi:hypothetical protein M0M57_06515 [Flavobacterium azooxidireducens]|uniref:DKNYY family protein n=1 Tax=Flavobacterium azooxidireducens TaxID=1871076 RepID=A0ABY4KL39_9FLAO|nr:hypothetical protein [Flavobacterium azooxidireducens]UPQ80488.1 hypothetical protein M0M57_06515 [Flavobacterium azooxidireducens]
MKKIYPVILVFSSFFCFGQTLILDEKIEKDYIPLRINFLPKENKIVFSSGTYLGISTNEMIKNIYSYDHLGTKEILLENEAVMNLRFSTTEKSFYVEDYAKMSYTGPFYRIFTNGIPSKKVKYEYKTRKYAFNFRNYGFNDTYEFGISNQKGNEDVNCKEDDIFIEVTDINTRKAIKNKIDKPSIERIEGEGFIKYIPKKNKIGFGYYVVGNEGFQIISKSISADYRTIIMYRTNYNTEGKFINEDSFKIELNKENTYFVYSNNGGSKTTTAIVNNLPIFSHDLAINNFVVDKDENVYIYGITGPKAESLNTFNVATGYYIFKFNKNGDKIWESFHEIKDESHFNKKRHLYRLFVDLDIFDDKILFSTGTDYVHEHIHYSILNSHNGDLISTEKLLFDEKKIRLFSTGAKRLFYPHYFIEEFQNKIFDVNSLIANKINKDFNAYLASIKNNENLSFKTLFSQEGIWLVETDHINYYKVNYFDN